MDNFSKYGLIEKSYDKNPRYSFVKGDVSQDDPQQFEMEQEKHN